MLFFLAIFFHRKWDFIWLTIKSLCWKFEYKNIQRLISLQLLYQNSSLKKAEENYYYITHVLFYSDSHPQMFLRNIFFKLVVTNFSLKRSKPPSKWFLIWPTSFTTFSSLLWMWSNLFWGNAKFTLFIWKWKKIHYRTLK